MAEATLTYEQKLARARAEHDHAVHAMTPQSMPPLPPPSHRGVDQTRRARGEQQPSARATKQDARPSTGKQDARPCATTAALSAAKSAAIAAAWTAFFAADEAIDAMRTHATLCDACGAAKPVRGPAAFHAILSATLAAADVPRRTKSLVRAMADQWDARPRPRSTARLLISGAGPVGLRAAVEAALMGMSVTVVERRVAFSRVNILTLWPPTAEDLSAYGAHAFYARFSTASIGNAPLHLGTREIQLVLLKNALLLGVELRYGEELMCLQPPAAPRAARGDAPGGGGCWHAWLRASAVTETHQTRAGALAFKPLKSGEYASGVGQGKCNLLQVSGLDPELVVRPAVQPVAGADELPLDALLLAEGEWSDTCKRLGISKSVDRFTQAIGLVLNLVNDPNDSRTNDQRMRSMYITPLDPIGRALIAGGVEIEFGEYLKGATHYIAMTVKKATLLRSGALRADLPSAELLTKGNLDEASLMHLARQVAIIVGLPPSTAFCDFHPAKLFDYSTRARCLSPFRVLAHVEATGSAEAEPGASSMAPAADGGVAFGMDREAHPLLHREESRYYARTVAEAEAEVAARAAEKEELQSAIAKLKELVRAGVADVRAMQAKIQARRAELGEAVANHGGVRPAVTQEERDLERRKEQVEGADAQLVACERALVELAEKARVHAAHLDASRARQAEWQSRTARVRDVATGAIETDSADSAADEWTVEGALPIFPVGDALIEPFWPESLGSNRGFHSALDAVWAAHLLVHDGLNAALLERSFWFDLMLRGPWQPRLLKPAKGWWADPASRYSDRAIVDTKGTYTNKSSKRLFRGAAATPERIAAMALQPERGPGLAFAS